MEYQKEEKMPETVPDKSIKCAGRNLTRYCHWISDKREKGGKHHLWVCKEGKRRMRRWITTRLIQPSFDSQSLFTLHSDCAKQSTYEKAGVWMEAWLEHAASQLQAVEQVFFEVSPMNCMILFANSST